MSIFRKSVLALSSAFQEFIEIIWLKRIVFIWKTVNCIWNVRIDFMASILDNQSTFGNQWRWPRSLKKYEPWGRSDIVTVCFTQFWTEPSYFKVGHTDKICLYILVMRFILFSAFTYFTSQLVLLVCTLTTELVCSLNCTVWRNWDLRFVYIRWPH